MCYCKNVFLLSSFETKKTEVHNEYKWTNNSSWSPLYWLCMYCSSLYWVIKELETRYIIWAPVLITQQECCGSSVSVDILFCHVKNTVLHCHKKTNMKQSSSLTKFQLSFWFLIPHSAQQWDRPNSKRKDVVNCAAVVHSVGCRNGGNNR